MQKKVGTLTQLIAKKDTQASQFWISNSGNDE